MKRMLSERFHVGPQLSEHCVDDRVVVLVVLGSEINCYESIERVSIP